MCKVKPLDLMRQIENVIVSTEKKSIVLINIVSAAKIRTHLVVRRLSKSKIFNSDQLAEAIEYYNNL